MKILIIKFRNIGDVLLITPLIRNLKYHYPNAKIDIALNKGTEEMITLNPNIENIIIYDRKKIKSLSIFKRVIKELKFALKFYTNRYDLVINLTKGDRGTLLSKISKAKIKIGYKSDNFFLKKVFTHTMPPQEKRHTIETNLDPLRALNLEIKDKKVEIFNSIDDDKIVQKYIKTQEFIHIHPVSRWLFKCIDDKMMARIIDFCKIELKKEVILTASPDKKEVDKIDKILSFCKTKPINLTGKLTLKQTSALNKKALCFIGVDTAIMHISAANDVKVLAFFGPSGIFHWGPWDNSCSHSTYRQKNGTCKMGKHTAMQVSWDCVPCGQDGCNGSKISDCLMRLDFEKIKQNIKKMI